MSSVEAAASLFGPEEPASDPFSTLGTEETHTSTLQQTAESLHLQAEDTENSFFSQANNNSTAPGEQQDSWPAGQYDYNSTSYTQSSESTHEQAQGWYDEQGVWHAYERPSTSNAHLTSGSLAAPSSAYSPYAPQTAYAPSVQATTQQSYTPYQPTSQTSSNNYTPAAPAAQSAYEPYQPPTSFQPSPSNFPPANSYATPSYSYANETPYAAATSGIASVPPPPAPKAPLNRPKVVNAYDPPFPVSTKRGSASRASAAAASYSAYNAYATPPVAVGTYSAPPPSQPPPPPRPFVQPPAQQPPPAGGMYASSPYPQGPSISESLARASQVPPASSHAPSHTHRPTPSEVYLPNNPNSFNPYSATQDSYNPGPAGNQSNPGTSYGPASGQNFYPGNYTPSTNTSPQKAYKPPNTTAASWSPPNVLGAPPNISRISHGDFGAPRAPPNSHSSPPPNQSQTSQPSSTYGSTSPPTQHPHQQKNGFVHQPFEAQQNYSQDSYSTSVPSAIPHTYVTSEFHSDELRRSPSPMSWSVHSMDDASSSHSPSSLSDSYVPKPGEANPSERSLSPDAALKRPTSGYQSFAGVPAGNPYQPYANGERSASPISLNEPPNDPYVPRANGQARHPHDSPPDANANRTTSPLSSGYRAPAQSSNPYAPPPKNGPSRTHDRNRSMSNGSSYSSKSGFGEDVYVPQRQQSESYTSRYDYQGLNGYEPSTTTTQELHVPPYIHAQYAPSPSLLGSNDPLGRTAVRIPVFSFGFGGKFVTCFHNDPELNTGFDVALSTRKSTAVQIRVLNKIIPESALDSSAVSYPGPLFSDPGTPTAISLVRTGMSAQTKVKKARVVKYLTERAEEISRAIGYLHQGTPASREAEGKLILVNLLKVMVENDGRLSGTPQIDLAVRAALVSRLGNSPPHDAPSSTPSTGFSVPADLGSVSDLSVPFASIGLSSPDPNESPISVTTLRPSALDKIQDFLVRGERQKAYHFALDEKLWAHAMVISSSIDKEAWQEVVREFLKSELGAKVDPNQTFTVGSNPPIKTNGREGLRVAYSLFSGQGAAAVQELVPQSLLARASGSIQVPLAPPMGMLSPMTPSFPPPAPLPTAKIPAESLALWTETAAMIYSSPLSSEASIALTSLGDHLASNKWIEAAHACYLLSPQTSPMGGLGNPATRLFLIGAGTPQSCPTFYKDPDTVVFTEIAEFALSLATPSKGQEPFAGLPHLQAFRLLRASSLAELGYVQLASRYVEAISSSRTRPSAYFTSTFEEQLKGLSDRIVGAPHLDKSGSWIGAKMAKPSMDSIGNWLEGRFTKLITGDGDNSPTLPEEDNKTADKTFSGPFTHYSTISSATNSPSPSPQPTTINSNVLPPPRRTGSAMAYPSPASSYVQIDRASSAMDYVRHKPSPVPAPRILSAGPGTTTFNQSPSFGQAVNAYTPTNNNYSDTTSNRSGVTGDSPSGQDAPWWGSTYSEESNSQTPTASTFLRSDEAVVSSSSSSSGFISLMDDTAYSVAPPSPAPSRLQSNDIQDEEDLGFGNSKRSKQSNHDDDSAESAPNGNSSPTKEPAPQPETKPAATSSGGGWLSRLWGRGAAPGPIKASLGEDKTFYYDSEQKRWINKNAPPEPPKPAAPPPPPSRTPSRAQTASPSRSGGPMGYSAPPTRPASAIDLTTSPPTKAPLRARSNLVPESAPSTPITSSMTPPPPPGRPLSQASSRRNIRNRYVDVLQQGGSS